MAELRTSHNQITGDAMDALIKSLPIVSKSYICAVLSKEQGVMTTTQAAAAKAKGWKPMYWQEEVMMWQEYEGIDDPTGIDSVHNSEFIIQNSQSSMVNGQSVYDLQGRKLSAPQKGITIIHYSDGSSRKVLEK